MEEVIQKAIEGGYQLVDIDGYSYSLDEISAEENKDIVLDPLFWQALGKVCGWEEIKPPIYDIYYGREKHTYSTYVAASFHEINLTEGWDKAVEYLKELIK